MVRRSSPTRERKRKVRAHYRKAHPYSDWTAPDLRQLIDSRGYFVPKSMRKVDLVDALENLDNHAKFRFQDLPPEIRLMVYRFAFIQNHPVRRHCKCRVKGSKKCLGQSQYNFHKPVYSSLGHGPEAQPAITRVSKIVRGESLSVFYSVRRFDLLKTALAIKMPKYRPLKDSAWLTHLPTDCMSAMRSFRIYLGSRTQSRRSGVFLCIDFAKNTHHIRHFEELRRFNEGPVEWRENLGHGWRHLKRCVYKSGCQRLEQQLDSLCQSPGVRTFGREELQQIAIAFQWGIVAKKGST